MVENAKQYPAFLRHLPGGGFVAIEVSSAKPLWQTPRFRGRVVVERRSIARGGEHQAPVIATASGPTVDDVVEQLFPAAQSNASIAAALLRLGPGLRRSEHVSR